MSAPPEYVPDSDFPYRLQKIVDRKLDLPWAMAFLPDGRCSSPSGRAVRLIEGNNMLGQSISGVPEVHVGGHSGLLDVLVDRDFPKRIGCSFPTCTQVRAVRRSASSVLASTK